MIGSPPWGFTLFLAGTSADVPVPDSAGRVLGHAPERVRDPFLDDGKAPARDAQLYDALDALEAAAAKAEAKVVYRFDVSQPSSRWPERYCIYLVKSLVDGAESKRPRCDWTASPSRLCSHNTNSRGRSTRRRIVYIAP